MAVYSMTGYANAQASAAPAETGAVATRLGIEVRTVNSRFLDLAFRLSEDLRQYEPQLRELVAARVKRGKVEVRAQLESTGGDTVRDPSPRLLQRLATLQDSVRSWMPDVQPLSVADVLRLSGSESAPPSDLGDQVQELAKHALDELSAAREREGARLAAMLLSHLKQLRELARQAKPLVPQLVEQQRQRFLERWKEAMAVAEGTTIPEAAQDRALSEATAFAIRIDVAEELTRLASHIEEIESLVRKGGEIGKRLDFLIQELHREANTLGSKSAVLEMTRISVDMKVLIEQMREQVQNIE
ncbi:YicC/YloC family endoribonuclease [Ramlibacter sp. PS4R-6]|uniref:YicC/YloC family endoribonuclease n=1 Tax=Ramlibacter sp. PS4R-6 TaxID=3133438 RepID=UPI0030B667CC